MIRTPSARPLSVFVVDTYADAADSLALLLNLHGHQAAPARSVRDAVARVRVYAPDVLVLAGAEPDDDGRAIVAATAALPRRPFLVAVGRRYGRADGFDAYLDADRGPGVLVGLLRRFEHFLISLGDEAGEREPQLPASEVTDGRYRASPKVPQSATHPAAGGVSS